MQGPHALNMGYLFSEHDTHARHNPREKGQAQGSLQIYIDVKNGPESLLKPWKF